MDKAAADLKNTDVRLKDTVTQVIHYNFIKIVPSIFIFLRIFAGSDISFWLLFQLRSSRNFCIDIVLLIIVLGIAAYLYK